LTYRRILDFINKLNSQEHIFKLNDKVAFNRHFNKFINRNWLSSSEMTIADFQQLCNDSSELIVKPLDDCEGQWIELLTLPDDKPTTMKDLYQSLKQRKVIIEQRICNHPLIEFNNSSINTIRVNSIMDKTGNVHIFKPVLRVGVGDSVVDNYNAGGLNMQ
jgi:hypothetical protein